MATTERPASEQTTIVCAVEGGWVEDQTVLMLESLRRWGGDFGQSRVLAVIPRRGPALKPSTRATFKALNVELHDATHYNRMPWFPYYCKIAPMLLASAVATTPVITWLDGDILVLGPPVGLTLSDGQDLGARRERHGSAVTESRSESEPFWRRACELVGLRWDDVPWLPADHISGRQRLYLNAGLYSVRRELDAVETYAEMTEKLLGSRLMPPDGTFWLGEQVAFSLMPLVRRLNFQELPAVDNHMIFQFTIDGPAATPPEPDARLVHYSKSMFPEWWDRFMHRIEGELPKAHAWLHPKGPLTMTKYPRTPISLARKVLRNLRYRQFGKSCVRV